LCSIKLGLITPFLFIILIFGLLLQIGQSPLAIVNVNADKDCGKDCEDNRGSDNGSTKPADSVDKDSGDNSGDKGSGDNSGGKDCGKDCVSNGQGNDNGGGNGVTTPEPETTCPKADRGPNGICSHTESYFVPPRTGQTCPQGTSEIISNGKRFCSAEGSGQYQPCPEGTVFTQGLKCGTQNTNTANATANFAGIINNGTLTIKKLILTTKELIPDASYKIIPNPYTFNTPMFVHDNDKNDFNRTKGIVVLKNIPFSSYIIQEVPSTEQNYYVLHEARISINNWLPHPILNMVEDRNLGKPLLYNTTIPFQYIVALKDNVIDDPQLIADKLIAKGAKLLHIYKYAMKGFAVRIPNLKLLDEIANDPRIANIEQDKIGRIASSSSTILPETTQTIPTGLMRIDENVQSNSSQTIDHTQLIKEAQNSTGRGLVNADVAILDTGISQSHPDLSVYRNVTFVPGTTSGDDDNGHGSHVAGTVAAKDNSFGVVGVAPGARLWSIKVCDEQGHCPLSNQIKGLDFVTQHSDEIDVLNISIDTPLSTLLDRAVSRAVAAGVTVVASAGNSGRDAKFTSPAHNPDVISVSAIADSDGKCGGLGRPTIAGPDDTFANFSNFGPSVTIAAPGVDILSTYYGQEYGLESGTSMAAPHVTGYAAIYKSHHQSATPYEVRSALLSAADVPTTICDGKSHGYFASDKDTFREPLLYINNVK
jgi:hypothetical protein